jgi:tripartite-type tricarboxylate transporter receptor subunit TctC
LIAGDVEMMFDGLGSSANHIKGGRIKALMMAGAKRNPAFPDVPSAAELGFPEYTVTTWYGIWVPKGTLPKYMRACKKSTMPVCRTSQGRVGSTGREFGTLSPQQFGNFVSAEVKRWSVVVKASGAKLD